MEKKLTYILNFTNTILQKLEKSGKINLVEYSQYKKYIKDIPNSQNTETLSENNILIEEIKVVNEKIKSFINKPEYFFIKDYFITRGITNFDTEGNNFETQNDHLETNENNNEDSNKIIEQFCKEAEEEKTSPEIKRFSDMIYFTSHDFLANKLKLSEEDIINIKGQKIKARNIDTLDTKASPPPKEKKQGEKATNELNLSYLTSKTNATSRVNRKPEKVDANIQKIKKEMEEELNNEIFNYTKNMKSYASNFNDILSKDNKTLNKIETIQNVDQNKTNKQLKSLNEFNYSLKIGFIKLIVMIIIASITFIMTLLSIRIFPKLV